MERATPVLALSENPHPYSRLNEMVQQSSIMRVAYNDEGFVDGFWRACVAAHLNTGDVLTGKAAAASKATAKRLAAGAVLHKFDDGLKSATSEDSGYSSGDTSGEEYIVDPAKQERTKKQKMVLSRATTHLDVLRGIARGQGETTASTVIMSIDLEVFESDHTRVLEVGVAWLGAGLVSTGESAATAIECRHFRNLDSQHLRNTGKYNQGDNFLYGATEDLEESSIAGRMGELLSVAGSSSGRVLLVGHTIQNDIEWLRQVGVDLEQLLPSMVVCDVGQAYQALRDEVNLTSLIRMMAAYGLASEAAHNAGNDAMYGVQTTLEMIREIGLGTLEN